MVYGDVVLSIILFELECDIGVYNFDFEVVDIGGEYDVFCFDWDFGVFCKSGEGFFCVF